MTTSNSVVSDNDDSYDEINKKLWKIWRNAAGLYHRDSDLPALIFANDEVLYFKNGHLHRDGDLPAVIRPVGEAWYYKNGKIHRDDNLPAVIRADGRKEYWIEGVKQK